MFLLPLAYMVIIKHLYANPFIPVHHAPAQLCWLTHSPFTLHPLRPLRLPSLQGRAGERLLFPRRSVFLYIFASTNKDT